MDEYQHLLYFEANELTKIDSGKIWRYFQKKRASGGGDCLMIRKVGEKAYKICFKEKEDQERVLLRKFHTISLPSGELRLTVSPTNSLQNPDQPSTSPSRALIKADKKGLERSYSCYHRFKPKVIKLPRNPSFVTDVHKMDCYAAVVGEKGAVKEKTAVWEKRPQTMKELPVEEKQFKLVEQAFIQEMHVHCPEVKIHRDVSTVILEGSDKEVQSGAKELDELIKRLKEKRIKLSTPLINFMKSSGAISKYRTLFLQSLANPVSVVVGSDLALSSLSFNVLDEAEATLQKDLSLVDVRLQIVPPDRLREIMIKAKDQANNQELRLDVSFIPEFGTEITKVQLVGYTETVNKLKEVLHDYQMNQVQTQKVLKLPYPELVDSFDEVLNMIDIEQTNVTIQASHFPSPCMIVSGPNCLVHEVEANLNTILATLISDNLVLVGPGAQWYFQEEGKMSKELVESSCRVLIREQQGVYAPNAKPKSSDTSSSSITRISTVERQRNSPVVNKTSLEIKLCGLEDDKVNVLVAPMLQSQLTSTNVGQCLLKKAGNSLSLKFRAMATNCTLTPGDVLQVDAPPSLGCAKLFFIECIPWDGVRGQSEQALSRGLKTCLELCIQQRLCSVAFPVIGPGILKYPLTKAIGVLTENIRQFGLCTLPGSISTIHIVIKPGYSYSEECYDDMHRNLSSNTNHYGQAIFRTLKSDLDNITLRVGGGVKLQVVFGDITNETTEAVVNLTGFKNFTYKGVCKDILTLAGPQVVAELKAANVNRGDIFVSQGGSFPCTVILHVCGQNNAAIVEQLVIRIIEHCEIHRMRSVAIPALSAGNGGYVAGAILRGVKAATSSTSLHFLTDIHLVLIKINTFLAFKEKATQMFFTPINRAPEPPLPYVQQQQSNSTMNTYSASFFTTTKDQKSIFLILGFSRKDVDEAMAKIKSLYQVQCSTHTFKWEELAGLTPGDKDDLKQLVETQGLYIQKNKSDEGSITVHGLKDGVNKVMHMINTSLHGCLKREVREREEDDLYTRVAWCILGQHDNWERVPKGTNHNLERKATAGGIVDAQGINWSVNLQRMEATLQATGQTTKLKRLVNLPDFTLPLYWESMDDGTDLKRFELPSSSPEYHRVKRAFKRTLSKTVMKIERVQNVHLRCAYEVQKKRISDKNRLESGACEKHLYHGTKQDSCASIMQNGFNRSFAGKNATSYGHGTYFAVNASYSARYSKPAADGSQSMFVVKVLTGIYTLGHRGMKFPPLRNHGQPHDYCDSVVDVVDNPNMFVVFHDNQAYPEYLITFK